MFQFPAYAHLCGVIDLPSIGLPHSEIRGSMDICSSPWLIAAYHVLLRLQEPRHPPCALLYFLGLILPVSLPSYQAVLANLIS